MNFAKNKHKFHKNNKLNSGGPNSSNSFLICGSWLVTSRPGYWSIYVFGTVRFGSGLSGDVWMPNSHFWSNPCDVTSHDDANEQRCCSAR